jgi:hypothetical protein
MNFFHFCDETWIEDRDFTRERKASLLEGGRKGAP